jgi:hypothetical protein
VFTLVKDQRIVTQLEVLLAVRLSALECWEVAEELKFDVNGDNVPLVFEAMLII